MKREVCRRGASIPLIVGTEPSVTHCFPSIICQTAMLGDTDTFAMLRRFALIAVLAALTSCTRTPHVVSRRSTPPSSAEQRQCLLQLGAAQARFTPLPDQYFGAGCSTVGTVRLLALRSDTAVLGITNLGPVSCPLANTFAAWARYGADRAARQVLGSPLVRIETMGSYSCRDVAGTGRRSAHASARGDRRVRLRSRRRPAHQRARGLVDGNPGRTAISQARATRARASGLARCSARATTPRTATTFTWNIPADASAAEPGSARTITGPSFASDGLNCADHVAAPRSEIGEARLDYSAATLCGLYKL